MMTFCRAWCGILTGLLIASSAFAAEGKKAPSVTKIKDIIVHRDTRFYSAFPSVVRLKSGELLASFRRAPDRRIWGEKENHHSDPNSQLMLVRSSDNGETWTETPELIHAHPFGGTQEPNLIVLQDDSLVCSSYAFARVRDEVKERFPEGIRWRNFVWMGGYLLRSEDGGHTWSAPIIPPPVPGGVVKNVFGKPCPAFNHGAMCQGGDGRLYWAVATKNPSNPQVAETHLMTSDDGGRTWAYACLIAKDDNFSINETSLHRTPKGDLVAFMRTTGFDDHTLVARSTDGGKSFERWQDAGWQGHPHYALQLPDARIFLVYGYRHKPFGIRARILNAECTDFKTAAESVLRDDGLMEDLGYPWATLTQDGKILVVYYFHDDTGNRHIAGTLLSIGSQ